MTTRPVDTAAESRIIEKPLDPLLRKEQISVRDLSHVTLTASDQQRSAAFYQGVFGIPQKRLNVRTEPGFLYSNRRILIAFLEFGPSSCFNATGSTLLAKYHEPLVAVDLDSHADSQQECFSLTAMSLVDVQGAHVAKKS